MYIIGILFNYQVGGPFSFGVPSGVCSSNTDDGDTGSTVANLSPQFQYDSQSPGYY